MERIERWTRELRLAAERSLISAASLEQQLRDGLAAIYRKMVDRGGVIRYVPGVERFTLDKIKPQLRNELDRRILASANLIKLNRAQAIDKTLQRFQGWSTSIPKGGVSEESKREVKANVRKSLASLPFEERRLATDQGHKLIAAISDIVAADGGAIAAYWVSHYTQPGYAFRPDHKERDHRQNDGQPFLIRDSWAARAGYVKKGKLGYVDEVTQPAQEPFCLPGDSRIELFDDAEKLYRRWYSGELTTIITASGKTLRATPNHPILTPQGWVAIGALNEGDSIIEVTEEVTESRKLNANQAHSTFVEFYDATAKSKFSKEILHGSRANFHGDGADADIDVVTIARPLRFNRKPILRQVLDYFRFAFANILNANIGAVNQCLKWPFFAAKRLVTFPAAVFILENSSACFSNTATDCVSMNAAYPRQFIGRCFSRFISAPQLRAVERELFNHARRAEIDQAFQVPIPNSHSGDAHGLGDLVDRLPLGAQPVDIVHIKQDQFTGHVYNLQTGKGWFVGESIIVSNCRCYYRYAFALRDLPPEMLTAKGKAALARVQGGEEVRSARTARADSAEVQITQRDGLGPRAEAALATAERCDLMRYFDGLKRIAPKPGESEWHAEYDEERDQIVLHPSFEDLSETEKVETLLHEAGHRGEQIDPQSFGEFKTRHLDDLSSFESIANPVHLAEFKRTGKIDSGLASEVFAESYARAMLGLPMPYRLREFWDDRLGSVGDRFGQAEANYIATWPNRITRCQRCTMFLRVNAGTHGNGCTAVRGEISAHGHCRLFEIGQPEKVSRETLDAGLNLGRRLTNTNIPVPVDRDHDVQWMFVVSKNCDRLYADRTLPRRVTIKSVTFDPADLGWAHESGEWLLMMKMVKAFVELYGRQPNEAERVAVYDHAHKHGGIPAEKKRAAELGVDWDGYEAWSRGELARLENRPIRRPPPDEHVEPTGHRRHELMEAIGA